MFYLTGFGSNGMGMKYTYRALWFLLLLGFCSDTRAQLLLNDSAENYASYILLNDSITRSRENASPFTIGEIFVTGNKRTKPYIIERELPFRRGDSVNLSELVKGFEIARQQLMNTTLFNDVVVSLKAFRGYTVDVQIDVKERWYIFPIPYFKPIDRNLAEWFKQDLSLERVNYGFKFNHNNFTGRNDKLRLWLITGYTQQLQFQYEQPYADRSLKHGFKVGFTYSSTREINFATVNNEQQFTDTLGGLKRWNGFVEYLYRPGLRTFNAFRLSMVREEVDDRLLKANPNYFPNGQRSVIYPEFSYRQNYYKVDYIPYPLTGWMSEISFLKRGINRDMNLWQIGGKYMHSWKVANKTWYAGQAIGVLRAPFDQPFVNQRLFGYQDMYLRGLENYVVDGVGGLLFRNSLRREILKFDLPTGLKSRAHAVIPFKFYVKVFGDLGYSHNPVNPENSLTNRMLYTAGFGVDMVTFYDFVLRLDYGFNQLGENGLFLHIKSDF